MLELLFAATGDRPERLAAAAARPYESVLGTLPPLSKVAS
jgi:hypothetical protein